MKLNLLWLSVLLMGLVSCLDTETFPDEPSIQFSDIRYAEVGGFLEPDSLIVKFEFEDGDGDLGLRAASDGDREPPFNDFSLFAYNPTSRQVTEYALDTLSSASASDLQLVNNIIRFSDRRNVPELDTLPDYTFPEYCAHWREIQIFGPSSSEPIVDDTVYYHDNPRFNNIYVRFFVETSPGSNDFEEFFWEYSRPPECNVNYNGRFPLINEVGREKTSEGTITYRMTSVGWRTTFQNNRIKLRIFIFDRAGNKSNVIETPPFRLEEIQ